MCHVTDVQKKPPSIKTDFITETDACHITHFARAFLEFLVLCFLIDLLIDFMFVLLSIDGLIFVSFRSRRTPIRAPGVISSFTQIGSLKLSPRRPKM